MDKVFLIGHRGVGKTSLLTAFQKQNPRFKVYDLDQEVTERFKRPIASYFKNSEEMLFREREQEVLNQICQTPTPFVVALGAGFLLEQFKFPADGFVLWVRRETDALGRIFLDTERPSLTKSTDPLEEWEQKFLRRELLYKKVAHSQVLIPERVEYSRDILGRYLFEPLPLPQSFYCTLLPHENMDVCFRGNFGIEIRNDIWSELDIHKILKQVSWQRKVILAIRNLNSLTIDFLKHLDRSQYPNLKVDWDIVLAEQAQRLIHDQDQQNPSHAPSHTDTNNTHTDPHVDAHDHVHTHAHAHTHTHAHTHAHTHVDVHTYSDARTHVDARAHSHTDARTHQVLLPNFKSGDIISEHRSTLEALELWAQNQPHEWIYKFAPEVNNIDEALEIYSKFKQGFSLGAFLPRSSELDLSWLRMVLAPHNVINFFRFSEGSSLEQPLWFDLKDTVPSHFYGILGEKVSHSLTPDMHRDFFGDKSVHPVRISLPASQIKPGFLNQLSELGVRYLAVTSPYKNLIYQDVKPQDPLTQNFQSINTAYLGESTKQYANTDYLGLKLFLEQHLDPELPTLVFGGGSLLKMLQELLPEAFFVAARTNSLRVDKASEEERLRHRARFNDLTEAQVVWAAGEKGMWPRWPFVIKKVLDLDYKSNSKAKRWVYSTHKQTGQFIPYVSGLDFFKHQGVEQQKFWSQYDI